jgi:hypothetical protein
MVSISMVFYIRRKGSDRQNRIYLEYRTHLQQRVHRAQDWLTSHREVPGSERTAYGEQIVVTVSRQFGQQ